MAVQVDEDESLQTDKKMITVQTERKCESLVKLAGNKLLQETRKGSLCKLTGNESLPTDREKKDHLASRQGRYHCASIQGKDYCKH